jgi:hypothetical protein
MVPKPEEIDDRCVKLWNECERVKAAGAELHH